MAINLISVLGPTATGKTSVATHLAKTLDTEIISADSRQVYRQMDLGTGKDIEDYTVDGVQIPYHLIDIVDPGTEYNVFEYQKDFIPVFEDLTSRGKTPILCGGSGMYLEAVLKGYRMIQVPANDKLRDELSGKSIEELTTILSNYKSLHNSTDIDTKKRAIRAIEIEEYTKNNETVETDFPEINSLIIGIDVDRELRRRRITNRLKERLEHGMIKEVEDILESGVTPEALIYYGLEYKFVTNFILGNITYNEMYKQLNIAIHQFAKRQMTWFRKMERHGFKINWIDGTLSSEQKVEQIMELYNKQK